MQRVRYIESSGTQYIDTGFKPNQDTRVVCTFRIMSETETHQTAFGTRDTASAGAGFCVGIQGHIDGCFRSDYGGEGTAFSTSVTATGLHVVDQNKNVCTIDGEETITHTEKTFSTSYNMYLATMNSVGSAANAPARMRLYSCQIYDNGTLVRDFVPCLDDDGVACLYDTVESKYYYNAGSGSFTAGGPVVFFRRRPLVSNKVLVTITGSGNSSYCYATINGTTYTAAATDIEVQKGDAITFGVYGRSITYKGKVTIDGTAVLSVTSMETKTYEWTVPGGVKAISITMSYTSTINRRCGTITVTTS